MKKKIVILIFFIITPFIVFAYPKGDVDGDNSVKNMDYALIRNHIRKTSLLTGDRLKRADLDGKDGVNSMDYVLLRIIILNNINPTATVTSTPKPNATSTAKALTEAEKICESVKNNSSIDYKSFLNLSKKASSSDKYKDDYYAIKAAHDCANKYNKEVSVTKAKYHIYKKNDETISVQTNTNFNDSTIYIHDESDIYNYMKPHIYTIEPNSSSKCSKTLTLTNFNNNFDILPEKAGYSKSDYYFVKITEQNGVKVFNRNKGNKDSKGRNYTEQEIAKSDSYRVKNGKVLDPMYWDYKNSEIEYTVCPIPNDSLEFKNGNFKTVTRLKCEKCVNSEGKKTFKKRGISVQRSNTIISNIHHSFVDKDLKITHEIYHKYTGFFSIGSSADVTLKDSTVYSMTYRTSKGGHNSTYDLSIGKSVNVTLNKVKMYDDGKYNQLQSSADWGVMASNGSKNITILNSKLNRIDAHKGMYNLTVKNTIIGNKGITIVGTGDHKDNKMILENVTWKYTNGSVIKLRSDYGSTWNGEITIKNCTIDSSSVSAVIGTSGVAGGVDNTNKQLVFNQPIHSPSKININGLTIKSSASKIAVISMNKSRFEQYYLKYFNKNKQNSWPTIKKSNVTGKTLNNYDS